VDLDADDVWSVVASGTEGPHWYVDALPLVVRGAVDRVLGGAGRRWAPPDRAELRAGDTAGFWRVTRAAGRTLELEADVRSPGQVRLTTSVEAAGPGRSVVRQAVSFEPAGLAGQLYMVADLPSREVVVELVHRRLLAELDAGRPPGS
jgi:uncharacterized protein DUF2867